MKEVGIYVHIPFCKSKCSYCDFTSFCKKSDLILDYIKNLKIEIIERARADYIVKTIFIGGGTPSYIDAIYIKDIVNTIKNNYNVSKDVEITIEVNPGTADNEKLEIYKEVGINRISIGLQTSNDKILNKIGRIHNYNDFLETIKNAKQVGFDNINVDTMIGLPDQTIYDVEDTIEKLLKLDVQHISVYSLIVEPETPMEEMINKGKLKLPDEEIERYMYWYIKRKLEENGYSHYEISNFAYPMYKCKHNLDCWGQKEYLGFGASAASYEDNIRYVNTDSLEDYINNIKQNERYKNIKIEETQNKEIAMNEYMLLNLRKVNGLDVKKFTAKFNENPFVIYKKEIKRLLREELIVVDIDNIRLSNKGLDLANIVWEEFV